MLLMVACGTILYRYNISFEICRSVGWLEKATIFRHRRKIEARIGRCKDFMIATLNPTKHAKPKPMGIVPISVVRFEKGCSTG